MTSCETYFPRGSVKISSSEAGKRKVDRKRERFNDKPLTLFRTSNRTDVRKVNKKKDHHEKESREETSAVRLTHVTPLLYQTLEEGFVVVGCVQEIFSTMITVNLPNHLIGQVRINNVSNPYSQLLLSYTKGEGGLLPQDVPTLNDLFNVGELVTCCVERSSENDNSKHKVFLTLNPAHINRDKSMTAIKEHVVLVGAIKSIEDHGYSVDLGIEHVTSFLPFKNTQSYLKSQYIASLPVGKVMMVSVKKIVSASRGGSAVELSVEPEVLSKSVAKAGFSANRLTPGANVDVSIKQVLSEGIEVSPIHADADALADFGCYVHITHVPPDASTFFTSGKVFKATFLYSLAPLNILYFSLKNYHHVPQLQFKEGAVVSDAKVISTAGRSVYLELGAKKLNAKGFVSAKQNGGIREFCIGDTHKTRVMHYDYLEKVYICSLNRDIVEAQTFTPKELKIGQTVKCVVNEFMKDAGLRLKLGTLTVFAPITHLADHVHKYPAAAVSALHKPNSTVTAKILEIRDGSSVIVTLKPTLVRCEPLCDYDEAKRGHSYYGTVTKIIDSGIVVKFFGDTCGFIHNTRFATSVTGLSKKSFHFGQLIRCFVTDVKPVERKLLLSLTAGAASNIKVGALYTLVVIGCDPNRGVDVVIENTSMSGVIGVNQVTDHVDLLPLYLASFTRGLTIENALLFKFTHDLTPFFTLRTSVKNFIQSNPQVFSRGVSYLKSGTIVPCSVNKIDDDTRGIELSVSVAFDGIADTYHVSHQVLENAQIPINRLKENQTIVAGVKVENNSAELDVCLSTEVDVKMKAEAGLTLSEDYVRSASKFQTVNSGDVVLVEVTGVTGDSAIDVKLVNAKSAAAVGTFGRHFISDSKTKYKKGDRIKAVVLWQEPGTQHVHLHPDVNVFNKINGLDGVSEEVSFVEAEVLLVLDKLIVARISEGVYGGCLTFVPRRCHFNDFSRKKPSLCSDIRVLPCSFVNGVLISEREKQIKMLSTELNLKMDEIISDLITAADTRNSLAIEKKKISKESNRRHLSDMSTEERGKESAVSKAKKKKGAKSKIEEVDSSVLHHLDASSEADDRAKKRKRKNSEASENMKSAETKQKRLKEKSTIVNGFSGSEDASPKRKRKKSSISNENVAHKQSGNIKKKSKMKETQVTEVDKTDRHSKLGEGMEEEEEEEVVVATGNNDEAHLSLSGCDRFAWNINSKNFSVAFTENVDCVEDGSGDDDDDDDDDSDKDVRRRPKTAAEKKAAAKESEKRLRQAEQHLLEAELNPQSADHFERLTLAQPNNSLIWVKYMAHHLQATEIEKARAIATRALKVIGHREEEERLNVWVALLNLENLYGTQESLRKTLDGAARANDEYQVYSKMAEIYTDSKKIMELDRLTGVMVRKFKTDIECWLLCCRCLLKSGMTEKARFIFQRGLETLTKKHHVEYITRFALLENTFGSPEHAQTLMEHLITTYSARIPSWMTYVDMLVKCGRTDLARNVLERAITQKLPVKKMKTLYSKWLKFEEQHGTEASIGHVKQAAENYISSLSASIGSV